MAKPIVKYYYSDRFKDFLKTITPYFEDERLIVELEKKHNKKIGVGEFRISLIDFGEKENMISFITAAKLIKEYEKYSKTQGDNAKSYDDWFEDNLSNENFWKKYRTETRPGRFFSKMINDDCYIEDEDIEEFVNYYKSHLNSDKSHLEIVYGEDIIKYYNLRYSTIKDYDGSLFNSCMGFKNDRDTDYTISELKSRLQFYSKNPNVGLLILRETDKKDRIKGRALIWTLKNGKKYVDCVYVDQQYDYYTFDKYSKDNKYHYFGNAVESELEIDIPDEVKEIFGGVYPQYEPPYLDTFEYLTEENIMVVD